MDEHKFQDIRLISVAGQDESIALRRMAADAEQYLDRFTWSPLCSRLNCCA